MYLMMYATREYSDQPMHPCNLISSLTCSSTAPDEALFFIFFLFLKENIRCGYSLEAPRRGASNENPQHMFSWRSTKNHYPIPLLSRVGDLRPNQHWVMSSSSVKTLTLFLGLLGLHDHYNQSYVAELGFKLVTPGSAFRLRYGAWPLI